jgi:hypothetical protein
MLPIQEASNAMDPPCLQHSTLMGLAYSVGFVIVERSTRPNAPLVEEPGRKGRWDVGWYVSCVFLFVHIRKASKV